MAKTLNELSRELKDFIIDIQTDAYNKGSVNKYRYNNLKLEVLDPRLNKIPQVKIVIGISEAIFNIANAEKTSGGLGPDERYVLRWLMKSSVVGDLRGAWARAEEHIGKSQGSQED